MKAILIFLFSLFFLHAFARTPVLSEIRSMFEKSATSEQQCKELLKLLEPYDEDHSLFYGYKGCATMMMAEHVFNPFSKYQYFKKGKTILEKAIAVDDQNVELHFLRFCTQTNIPRFLGYNEHIDSDKALLLGAVSTITDAELKRNIKHYLLSSKYLTQTEKQQLVKLE
ncbi:MAG: hypothetical protein ACTHOF_18475 [Flavisolibacter sp.]|jgi:hypothetical protein